MTKSVAENSTNTGVTLWTRFASWAVERIGVAMVGKPSHGALTVIFPNGRTRTVGNPATGEHAVLRLNNFRVLGEAMQRGTVGFASAYMAGDIESDDLTALFRFFLQNRDMFESANPGFFRKAATDLHYHLSRRNTLEGSKKNIAEHYDLGNDFYGQWLDPSMTYSSAVFTSGDQSLEEAQLAKYRRLLENFEMPGFKEIWEALDIWGSDNVDFTKQAYTELISTLYQENAFYKGEYMVGGRKVDFKDIDVPILSLVARDDHVFTEKAAFAIHECKAARKGQLDYHVIPAGHVSLIAAHPVRVHTYTLVREFLTRPEKLRTGAKKK